MGWKKWETHNACCPTKCTCSNTPEFQQGPECVHLSSAHSMDYEGEGLAINSLGLGGRRRGREVVEVEGIVEEVENRKEVEWRTGIHGLYTHFVFMCVLIKLKSLGGFFKLFSSSS